LNSNRSRLFCQRLAKSALTPSADIVGLAGHFSFVPGPDMRLFRADAKVM
jgi:hypothetical protein